MNSGSGEVSIPNNEIWYTSTDGNIVNPYTTNAFGVSIISNTYVDGRGIIVCGADITELKGNAMRVCTTLESIVLPNSVTKTGTAVFYGCNNLIDVTLPENLSEIGASAFQLCSKLETIVLPASITIIGNQAFYNAKKLHSVYCKMATPPLERTNMFYGNASGRKIYVPTASVSKYKSSWDGYASDIVGYDF